MEYAIENVIAQSDGLLSEPEGMNNFYLYQFDGTTQYTVIPWDQDASFYAADQDILQGLDENKLTTGYIRCRTTETST